MQCAVIEYARNVLGYADAFTSEVNPDTTHPVIDLMPEQKDIEDMGGTMRLGAYPCKLSEGSFSYKPMAKNLYMNVIGIDMNLTTCIKKSL